MIWNTLTVTFSRDDSPTRLSQVRVVDSHGQVLLERQSPYFLVPSLLGTPRQARRQLIRHLPGAPELLLLTSWSGGAYGAYHDTLYAYEPSRGLVSVWSMDEGRGRLGKSLGLSPALTNRVRRVEWSSDNLQHHGLVRLDLQNEIPQLHLLVWNGNRLRDIPDWRP